MSGAIYLIQGDGQLVEMKEQSYDSENLLQELLAKYPNLLAGDQVDSASPRRWLLVRREMPVRSEEEGPDRWSVDHLFLDQDGIPTIVEVKRADSTEIRRDVVGQMLDYAANAVVHWPVETIKAQFETNCVSQKREPDQELATFIGEYANPDSFWETVKTNLQAGKIRMVFLSDEVPSELRRIVEFLNSQMDPAKVFAVEIKQYLGQGQRTLVPRVVVQPIAKPDTSATPKQWDEESFCGVLEARGALGHVAVAKKILEWARNKDLRISWGKGKAIGSFYPMFDHKGGSYYVIRVVTGAKTAYVEMEFGVMKPPFDTEGKRDILRQRLNRIPGIKLSPSDIDKYPSFPLSTLRDEAAMQEFMKIFDWYIEEIRGSDNQRQE